MEKDSTAPGKDHAINLMLPMEPCNRASTGQIRESDHRTFQNHSSSAQNEEPAVWTPSPPEKIKETAMNRRLSMLVPSLLEAQTKHELQIARTSRDRADVV